MPVWPLNHGEIPRKEGSMFSMQSAKQSSTSSEIAGELSSKGALSGDNCRTSTEYQLLRDRQR